MRRILHLTMLAIALASCGGCAALESRLGYEPIPAGMTKAEYDKMVAREAADPDFNYLDRMNEIDAREAADDAYLDSLGVCARC
jgi:hypothetical protein